MSLLEAFESPALPLLLELERLNCQIELTPDRLIWECVAVDRHAAARRASLRARVGSVGTLLRCQRAGATHGLRATTRRHASPARTGVSVSVYESRPTVQLQAERPAWHVRTRLVRGALGNTQRPRRTSSSSPRAAGEPKGLKALERCRDESRDTLHHPVTRSLSCLRVFFVARTRRTFSPARIRRTDLFSTRKMPRLCCHAT
jgi:hypothetical protein